ncbi:hypothetical protein [Streptomyces sp. NPDC055140]
MPITLFRAAYARLFPSQESATFSCARCGLRVQITDDPNGVNKILNIAESHPCKKAPAAGDAKPAPSASPHTVPATEFARALADWTRTHRHAIAAADSDTTFVPVTVNATTTIEVHPGLLRLLAEEMHAALTLQRNFPDLDPADLDAYVGSDAVIYHGHGEPDFEATAEDTEPHEDCNGRPL